MRTLLLEPSGDFSGDMIVGLLCDLGVQPSTFEWELDKVNLGAFHLHFERQTSGDTPGVHFGIHTGAVHTHEQDADAGEFNAAEAHVHEPGSAHAHEHREEHSHVHDHEHGDEHDHEDCQSAADLRASIANSELSDPVKQRALAVFDHFIGNETKTAHTDAVSLAFDHRNGLAACAQIVCACVGMAELGADQIHARQPASEPVAAAVLAGFRETQEVVVPEAAEAKTGCGVGHGGSLRGSLREAA